MTKEPAYHPSAPLGIAVTLSAIAGFIDAHMYLHVSRVFVANMSGNMIQLGMFAGLADWRRVAGAGGAIVAFLAGVVVATIHHDRQVRRGHPVQPGTLLLIESLLVSGLMVLLAGLDVTIAEVRPVTYLAIVVGAFAMGLQTMALRRVGAVAVATTYGTGTIVRVGEKLALGARGADRGSEHRRRVTIAVLLTILVGYVAGAAGASALGASPWFLLIVVVALVVAAAALSSANSASVQMVDDEG